LIYATFIDFSTKSKAFPLDLYFFTILGSKASPASILLVNSFAVSFPVRTSFPLRTSLMNPYPCDWFKIKRAYRDLTSLVEAGALACEF
jgi:hypothetical protein